MPYFRVGGGLDGPLRCLPQERLRGQSPRSNGGCSDARLAAPKDGLPLLDERLRRLPVVFGHPAPGVVPRLEVEQVLERPALRRVDVALHIAVRSAGPGRAARRAPWSRLRGARRG